MSGEDLATPPHCGTPPESGTSMTRPTAAERFCAPATDDDAGHLRKWAALGVLGAVAFMAQLDLFVVNVALPAMGQSYRGASLTDLSWVLNAYTVVFAALLIPAGRLADHYGCRGFLIAGTCAFTLASVICGAAPTLAVLVAGRMVQAAGAAVIVPASLGLLLHAFPARQHSLVVGLWAGLAAVAGTLGPTVGGLLVGLSWRWIFLINLPIGILIVALARRTVPRHRAAHDSRLPDALSAVSLLITITALVLATVKGPDWGVMSPITLGLYATAAAAALITVWRTIVHPHAMIEASVFASRAFSCSTIALLAFFIGFGAWLLISVLFLQDAWHYSALRTGLAIAPGPLVSLLWAVNAAAVADRFGRTAPAVAGALCMAAAAALWLLGASATPDYAQSFLPGLLLMGCAAGLVQAPLFAAASGLSADRATTGSAVLNTARQVGSAIGVALLVVLLGSGHATLACYRRGWWLLVASGVLSAVAVMLSGTRRRAAAASTPAPAAHPS
ncbi:MFS transporter [Mycobacterium montefiorense]|nr:MFS transporter [Mycobacterium montefiorense]